MTQTYKRKSARTRAVAPLLASVVLTGAVLTACSDGSSQAADADGPGAVEKPSPTGPEERGLAYAKCMRENGVPKFPDPEQGGGGIRIGPGMGVDPQSSEFKKAQEACKDLSPQGAGGPNGGKPLDSAKVAEWARCMRENGVPKFPDPEIDGGSMVIDMSAVGMTGDDPKFQEAMEACRDKRPSGGVMMKGGGGQ
ncbi:hypothetical protein ABT390_30710 [Streptomyces aurantiacus]|uniref:Lipoprotein n=1 Tax=Streptomyces aurantiacus JA 4570 TaxID=1286094 RepID=S4ATC0_9ACTN|nr:hypothetical protein [Streptomyces aurantiacus]EPH44662.1 hypothetical protein STRAU_2220 [Streptomyces aurantiacus JA 4570]